MFSPDFPKKPSWGDHVLGVLVLALVWVAEFSWRWLPLWLVIAAFVLWELLHAR